MIMVDGRAGSVDLIPCLPPELTKKTVLEAADVAWFGHGPEGPYTYPCGLEYKTVSELITCITNKRFVGEQFPKMTQTYVRNYFLIEGEYDEGPDGRLVVPSWKNGKQFWVSHGWQMTYRQFDNWQNSLTESGKIRFKRSRDRRESAAMVLDLYKMWTKDYEDHKSLFSFDKSQLPPMLMHPSTKRLVAAQLPGLGWELSQRVADYFPNIIDMVNAPEEIWTQIHGIGKTKAQKILNSLREHTAH